MSISLLNIPELRVAATVPWLGDTARLFGARANLFTFFSHAAPKSGTVRPNHKPRQIAARVKPPLRPLHTGGDLVARRGRATDRAQPQKPCANAERNRAQKIKKKVARQISPRPKIKHVWFSGAVGSTLWRRGLTCQNGVRWHADRTRSRQVVYIFFQVTCGTSKWRALPRLVRRYFQCKKCILNAVRLCAVTCAVWRADIKYIHYKLLSTRKEKYDI